MSAIPTMGAIARPLKLGSSSQQKAEGDDASSLGRLTVGATTELSLRDCETERRGEKRSGQRRGRVRTEVGCPVMDDACPWLSGWLRTPRRREARRVRCWPHGAHLTAAFHLLSPSSVECTLYSTPHLVSIFHPYLSQPLQATPLLVSSSTTPHHRSAFSLVFYTANAFSSPVTATSESEQRRRR